MVRSSLKSTHCNYFIPQERGMIIPHHSSPQEYARDWWLPFRSQLKVIWYSQGCNKVGFKSYLQQTYSRSLFIRHAFQQKWEGIFAVPGVRVKASAKPFQPHCLEWNEPNEYDGKSPSCCACSKLRLLAPFSHCPHDRESAQLFLEKVLPISIVGIVRLVICKG